MNTAIVTINLPIDAGYDPVAYARAIHEAATYQLSIGNALAANALNQLSSIVDRTIYVGPPPWGLQNSPFGRAR